MIKRLALIPARAGSQRVRHKNVRPLQGHPLIAYTIAAAQASQCFDRILVSTDAEDIQHIAQHYGADAPFLRPTELAATTSPDIDWVLHALANLNEPVEAYSILRPTSPFRQADTIRRAWEQFQEQPEVDSLRAVELCRQHPGKMWIVEGPHMRPLLDQSHLEVPWHSSQYQALPKVYVQNSSLEISWARVAWETKSIAGRLLMPFYTIGSEGFTIDYETDWFLAEQLLTTGQAQLPSIAYAPFMAAAA